MTTTAKIMTPIIVMDITIVWLEDSCVCETRVTARAAVSLEASVIVTVWVPYPDLVTWKMYDPDLT